MKLTIVGNDDDWEGLYIDGKLVAQGHSLTGRDILDVFGHAWEYRLTEEGWLEDQGHLPENIEEVQFG